MEERRQHAGTAYVVARVTDRARACSTLSSAQTLRGLNITPEFFEEDRVPAYDQGAAGGAWDRSLFCASDSALATAYASRPRT